MEPMNIIHMKMPVALTNQRGFISDSISATLPAPALEKTKKRSEPLTRSFTANAEARLAPRWAAGRVSG